MKILITGGAGFVGRHFINRLIEDHQICSIDIKPQDSFQADLVIVQEDCRDFFKREKDRWDLVIHLAAIVEGREKIEGDPIAIATDLSIDAEMFNWAVRTKQPKVIYFSSSAAYPIAYQNNGERRKLQEDDIDLAIIKTPDLTYGWAKLTGEMLAEYARKQGVAVYVFRPFSGYGEDQAISYPFAAFINRIRNKVEVFEIWGDGEQVRDFIHIDDIVEAVIRAVNLDIQEPINLGSGIPTSFNQLAKMAMAISGHIVPMRHLLEKPVGVMYRCSDNRKMLKFYSPKISLEVGIKRALELSVFG